MSRKKMLFIALAALIMCGCQSEDDKKEQYLDTVETYDQKHIDSTFNALKDSIERQERLKYDSMLKAEAKAIADSLQRHPGDKEVPDDMTLKSPKPSTQNLPEPTGPDYSFPKDSMD